MSKPVRYHGKVYASEGALVNSIIKNGGKLEVWINPNMVWKKMVLSFRILPEPIESNFIETTFFRVKKHMTTSQLENVVFFKSVLHDMTEKNFANFGKWIDQVRKNKERYETDVKYMTMVDCIKQMRSTQL